MTVPARSRAERIERIVSIVAPLTIGAAALIAWEALVAIYAIPHYILPGPSLVLGSLIGLGLGGGGLVGLVSANQARQRSTSGARARSWLRVVVSSRRRSS